jgi:hypothetical protein
MVFRSHGHLPLYISYFWRSTLNSPKQADTALVPCNLPATTIPALNLLIISSRTMPKPAVTRFAGRPWVVHVAFLVSYVNVKFPSFSPPSRHPLQIDVAPSPWSGTTANLGVVQANGQARLSLVVLLDAEEWTRDALFGTAEGSPWPVAYIRCTSPVPETRSNLSFSHKIGLVQALTNQVLLLLLWR